MTDFKVEDLVPHSGTMSLLDRIIGYDDDSLEAEVTITKDTLFADEKGVPAAVGLEYLAQAIAAYSGVQERTKGGEPKLGFLLGTRKYQCSNDYFELGQTLNIKVKCEMQADNGLHVFQCSLSGDNIEASASLNVFQPDDSEKFLKDMTV